MSPAATNVRMFAPEQWGQVNRFSKFASTTYKFTDVQRRALSGVATHLNKARTLHALAIRLRPNLEIDEAEIEANGWTPALHAHELSTVIEACMTEIYSSIDCTASVLFAVYGATTRGFKKSTSGMFKNFEKFSGSFPDEIKVALRSATWFRSLRYLRDELTHLDTGSCHNDRQTGIVNYMHTDMKVGEMCLIIDDIFSWLATTWDEVNRFIGSVFVHLNATLQDGQVMQMCGVVEGRILMRVVSAHEPLSFDSGVCMSRHWFDRPDEPSCPFKDRCGAYERKATSEMLARFFPE